jgi:hypothetical protein
MRRIINKSVRFNFSDFINDKEMAEEKIYFTK